MLTIKIIALVFVIIFGIPNQIIDYKHRKRKAYEPGNAWGYYANLAKQGNWEGRFVMWSGYLGIVLILVVFAYMFHALSK
jgi:hypothetical protein